MADKITRGTYIKLNDTGYRFACPEGHVALKLLQTPERKRRGNNGSKIVYEHENGKRYDGTFRCQTCNETYETVYDRKEDRNVRIYPPRK